MDIREITSKDGFSITAYISDGATAANYDVFFIAPFPCEVVNVIETHRVKGTGASPVLNIEKLTTGVALDSGTTILTTAFDLTSTINTPLNKNGTDLVLTNKARQLKTLDRLALKDGGTLTSIAGLQVTIYLIPLGKGSYQ